MHKRYQQSDRKRPKPRVPNLTSFCICFIQSNYQFKKERRKKKEEKKKKKEKSKLEKNEAKKEQD